MQIQFLGHSAFKVAIDGAVLLFDPFLSGNPEFKGDWDAAVADVTHVLLTHAHNDHFGDTIKVLEKTGALFVATPEMAGYVSSVLGGARTHGMNFGGTRDFRAFKLSMVPAWHSSSYKAPDGQTIYGGNPAGLIVHHGEQRLYHMGDTSIFSDMALINELYQPTIGIVPIGNNFTMGPDHAALAVNRYFDFKTIIPCHYGTFGLLEQSAEGFVRQVTKGEVKVMRPMDTITV